MQEVTKEYLNKYCLYLTQPAKGYRYSIDSFLLADFVSKLSFNSAIEIGGGCGVISLLLAKLKQNIKQMEIFELQKNLFSCLKTNIEENFLLEPKINLRNEDIRFALPSFVPDIIFSNPPFRNPGSGKVSPSIEKALARHEFSLSLEQLFFSVKQIAGTKTKFALIHLFERQKEIEKEGKKFGFFPQKIITVKPYINSNPKHIIFLFSQTNQEPIKESFFIYEQDGKYSKTVKNLLE